MRPVDFTPDQEGCVLNSLHGHRTREGRAPARSSGDVSEDREITTRIESRSPHLGYSASLTASISILISDESWTFLFRAPFPSVIPDGSEVTSPREWADIINSPNWRWRCPDCQYESRRMETGDWRLETANWRPPDPARLGIATVSSTIIPCTTACSGSSCIIISQRPPVKSHRWKLEGTPT